MRFTITPLGSAGGRAIDQVVDGIVKYLDQPRPTPTREALAGDDTQGASQYYTDGANEPGRWLGQGAAAAGLVGDVNPRDFARVLAGRDPRTGARLLGARGSAGRRPTLGVGTHTRLGADGDPLYDEHDAAVDLHLEPDVATRLLAAGTRVAVSVLLGWLSGHPFPVADPPGSFLVPIIDSDGTTWVRDSELTRCEQVRAAGPNAQQIADTGRPDDQLKIAEAARLAGVTSRYLRRLAATYDRYRDEIDAMVAAGEQPRRAYVIAHRGTRGQWLIERQHLVDFLARRHQPAVRVGYDLTLTTEKSLGILALMSPPAVGQDVLDAIQAGNDTGLTRLEQHAATRINRRPMSVGGWTAASFRHLTSRALDPFPHHHNVIANTVQIADGDRRALDTRPLYRHAVGASALATAEMRHQLTQRLGVRWRPAHHGGWEIDGVPDHILRAFSQRRSDIDDAIAELEDAIGRASTIDELQQLVTKTRPAKQQADPRDLLADWWQRARQHSFTPQQLAACLQRTQPPTSPPRASLFARLAAPDGICAKTSVFTSDDVLAALANLPVPARGKEPQPLLIPAAELERLADAFLDSPHVIELHPPADHPRLRAWRDEPLYTTTEILTAQQRIIDRYRAGRREQLAVVPAEMLATVLADHPDLTDEQRNLVSALCSSGARVQCAVGRAGTGKTTAMRVVAAAWQGAGFRVVGAAVKGEAARHLGATAGIPAETLAWYLARRNSRRPPLDGRTVLLVDEASTIADRDLDALLDLAETTGAAVRLIGDPAQHGAVGAGGMFRVLCEQHPDDTVELTTTHRLQDPRDRAAARALRDGDVRQALDHLSRAGHLHEVHGDIDIYLDLLTRWWNGRNNGQPHPMVDRSNHRRRQLNRLARRILQAHGQVGPDLIDASDNRNFAVGDEVIARRGNRHLHPAGQLDNYLRNGSRGRVTSVTTDNDAERDKLTVAFEGLGTITVPRHFFDDHPGPDGRVDAGIDHAYALTSYAVQGATYPVSTSRIDEAATRAETYVNITRGQEENHLYLTRATDPLDGERLPKAPLPPLDVSVTLRLQASAPEVTAWELGATATRPENSPTQPRRRVVSPSQAPGR